MEEKKSYEKKWVRCEVEQEYFGDERKTGKEDRKRKQAGDRSKYKKTDKDQSKKNAENAPDFDKKNALSGRVLSISSAGITVAFEGKIFICTLRGILKKEKTQFKNLVTVGDLVLFEPIDEKEGAIIKVETRHSILSRADNLSRRKEHLIAANIDQVLITASVVIPPLKPFLIDRYIIAAKKGNMQPVILINKIDLLEEESFTAEAEKNLFEEFIKGYAHSGIPLIPICAKTGAGMETLREIMKDKVSVFSGQSGVGKSTLINTVTGLNLLTGDAVQKTGKGAHTTTSANLLPLDFGGWCIDTPGIKSFGVWNLKKNEIEEYYSEIHEKGYECKFPNCSHTHETNCAVKEAVDKEEISFLRYASYVSLIETIDLEHKRR